MSAKISEVLNDSIAQEIGLEKDDEILKINNIVPQDYIDYKFLLAAEEIDLEIKKSNGEIELIEIEKDFEDDLGIVFESAIFDRIKPCTNKCIFCFVDQQPKGLRDSLYVKDDDYRLSYLQGTYVTLTNLTQKDKDRIKKLQLGPLYVSVHTTNPELRVKMLNNQKAANIMDELEWLKQNDIPIHTQIVLCPGYNDADELKRTLDDLAKLKSIVGSVAIVPVGITKYRKEKLTTIDEKIAKETIATIAAFNKKVKRNIACASDEFFLVANEPIPSKKYYGNFAQLEDGVGALRLIMDDFDKRKKKLPKKIKTKKEFAFATSYSAYSMFCEFSKVLNKVENLSVEVFPIKSNFWGERINVAGLICAKDLIEQLKGKGIKNLIISSIMLRPYSNEFLDGLSTFDIERELGCTIHLIKDVYSSVEIFDIIF